MIYDDRFDNNRWLQHIITNHFVYIFTIRLLFYMTLIRIWLWRTVKSNANETNTIAQQTMNLRKNERAERANEIADDLLLCIRLFNRIKGAQKKRIRFFPASALKWLCWTVWRCFTVFGKLSSHKELFATFLAYSWRWKYVWCAFAKLIILFRPHSRSFNCCCSRRHRLHRRWWLWYRCVFFLRWPEKAFRF